MISIWFFIGISLAVNGALIMAAGIYQVVNPPARSGRGFVQLARQCVVGRRAFGHRTDLLREVRSPAAGLVKGFHKG